MTFPLGRFGDSRVAPDDLFDAADPAARPPRDAIDFQFRTPVTLNTLLHMMAETDNGSMVEEWRGIYSEVAEQTRLFVQRPARGLDVERRGLAPARLAITTVVHEGVAGFEFPRWHLHVYVGDVATSLLDEQPIPVHLDSLRNATRGIAYPHYLRRVEQRTNQQWGLQWGLPGDWEVREIVRPDIADLVDSRDRGVCTEPGFSDVAHLVLPDQADLDGAAEGERVTARARAEGRPIPGTYTLAPLAGEDLSART